MTTRRQAELHRRDLAELVRLARRDLNRIMARSNGSAEETRDRLADVLPTLVAVYGAAAAALAADWYEDMRDQAGVRGRFRAIPAELPGREQTDILARWGTGPLFQPQPDRTAAAALVGGALLRHIANADRQTITQSATDDRAAIGWVRIVSGSDPCDFCLGLADELYDTPDFGTHDHCLCVASPEFG